MREFFDSGRVADLVIAVMIAEGIALAIYRRVTGRGISIHDLLLILLPGLGLVLALRAALTGQGWEAIAGFLALAFVFHIADLRRRWRNN